MKELILMLLLITPIFAQAQDPFPAIRDNVYYEYDFTPQSGNSTTISVCSVIYFTYRIDIFNVSKTKDTISFQYNLSYRRYEDDALVGSGSAIFNVRVDINRSVINGWWINVKLGKIAFEELVNGFASAIGADKVTINETTYNFNGVNRSVYYGYFRNTNTSSYGYFIVDKEYGVLLERAIILYESSNVTIVQIGLSGKMILKATNLFASESNALILFALALVMSIVVSTVIIIAWFKERKKR